MDNSDQWLQNITSPLYLTSGHTEEHFDVNLPSNLLFDSNINLFEAFMAE